MGRANDPSRNMRGDQADKPHQPHHRDGGTRYQCTEQYQECTHEIDLLPKPGRYIVAKTHEVQLPVGEPGESQRNGEPQ